ncbi:MAG TPA: hypothetical protein VGR21_01040, partial [Cryptosporangiaceae bacterium]|nr:hypothetical protein [Cryptosporangiaceae bacterium]
SRPAPNPRTALAIVLITAVSALLLIGGGTGYVLLTNSDDTDRAAAPTAAPVPPSAPPPTTQAPSADPSARPSRSPLSTKEPVLKSVPAVSVVGPTFGSGEPTYTFAFEGWPFAFRGPATWGCMAGTVEGAPDAYGWSCIDEKNGGARQRVNIMLRRCPTTCTAAEQKAMNKFWFDNEPERARRKDASTSYIEEPSTAEGKYALDMSHFFATTAGGTLQWQVGVYAESPPATRAVVQKVLNDVRTQTP